MIQRHFMALGILLFLLILLMGCDSSSTQNIIKADAMFSQSVLELPIECRASSGIYVNEGVTFYTSSLNYIKQVAIAQNICGAENVKEYTGATGDSWIHINVPTEGGKTDDYFLLVYPGLDGGKPRYIFSGMKAKLKYSSDLSAPLLLPYHLISDSRIVHTISAELLAGAEYETSQRLEDNPVIYGEYSFETEEFYNFYKNSGWYDVTKGKNSIIISREGQKFTFSFYAHAGQVFFSIV